MAGLLLDTCTFIWLTADPRSLSRKASKAIDAATLALYLSGASVWEICLKWKAGKLELPLPPRRWIEEQVNRWQLDVLPLNSDHFYATTELVDLHRDPFDRLIVTQAISEALTVVTPDAAIAAYPVGTLW
ncbi:MAG TPA: type II toxin-antitoxin system VapC family toxin [Myxococcaceae bacterium]|nr:type II toxin-antitoxin system VapC family toxin [Myxococcaceae bacterium]